ncbi:MAG: DUF4138 domain-containing protein [Phaeodactylibacter sp.]|nr:DUF4138 domain-containing protein [Phaeodactylibacter sp.]
MRTSFLSVLALANISFIHSQKALDTLFANEHQIHSLFFDSPIQKGIVGASNYAFNFNRETSESLGLLQAQKGTNSNLLVLTQDGGIYSFVVAYKEELESFTSFIPCSFKLNTKRFEEETQDNDNSISQKDKDYEKRCRQLLNRTTQFQQIRYQKGIRLKATESIYYGENVYMVYEIKNASAIDYEIDQLQLLKVLANGGKKSSYQELPIEPIYEFQLPKKVFQGNSFRFVVVYPKFTLGKYLQLKVVLTERNGSRTIQTSIK